MTVTVPICLECSTHPGPSGRPTVPPGVARPHVAPDSDALLTFSVIAHPTVAPGPASSDVTGTRYARAYHRDLPAADSVQVAPLARMMIMMGWVGPGGQPAALRQTLSSTVLRPPAGPGRWSALGLIMIRVMAADCR